MPNKASIQTPDSPRVQSVMTIPQSLQKSERALGQAQDVSDVRQKKMLPCFRHITTSLIAVLGASSVTSVAEEAVFPITPPVPIVFEARVPIADDFGMLRKMAVSTVALQEYKGIYRANGYEDIPDAQIHFPGLFVMLPDGSVVTKSKVQGYYQALFCSWLSDDRTVKLLRELRLSKHRWIEYGASTIHSGEQDAGGKRD